METASTTPNSARFSNGNLRSSGSERAVAGAGAPICVDGMDAAKTFSRSRLITKDEQCAAGYLRQPEFDGCC